MKVYELVDTTLGKHKIIIRDLQENILLCDERYGYGGDGRSKYSNHTIKDIDFNIEKKLLIISI